MAEKTQKKLKPILDQPAESSPLPVLPFTRTMLMDSKIANFIIFEFIKT